MTVIIYLFFKNYLSLSILTKKKCLWKKHHYQVFNVTCRKIQKI